MQSELFDRCCFCMGIKSIAGYVEKGDRRLNICHDCVPKIIRRARVTITHTRPSFAANDELIGWIADRISEPGLELTEIVLLTLKYAGQPLYTRQIRQITEIDSPRLCRKLGSLKAVGFVIKDAADRYVLTGKGKDKIAKLIKRIPPELTHEKIYGHDLHQCSALPSPAAGLAQRVS